MIMNPLFGLRELGQSVWYDDIPAPRLTEGLEEAKALMGQREEVGIDMKRITDELIDEGVESFAGDSDKLLEQIKTKAEAVKAGAGARPARDIWRARVDERTGCAAAGEEALGRMNAQCWAERLNDKGGTVWTPDQARAKEIAG